MLLAAVAMAQFADPQQIHPWGSNPTLRALDLDGDGDLDLISLHGNDHFKFHRNTDGAGTFAYADAFDPIDGGVTTFDLADLDGDGSLDLAFVPMGSTTVHVFYNLGDGQFAAPVEVGDVGQEVLALRLGDLNGDGLADLVFSVNTDNGGGLAWMQNIAPGFATPLLIDGLFPSGGSTTMLLGDMDLDGSLDIILFDPDGVVIAMRNETGTAEEWTIATVIEFPGYPFQRPLLVDIDGDGDLDIADAVNGAIQWAENPSANGEFGAFNTRTVEAFASAGPGAFGNMGCGTGTALVFVPANPTLPVRWRHWMGLLNDFSFAVDMQDLPRAANVLLADLDGDGRDDLVLGQSNGTFWYRNTTVPPSLILDMPTFDTLCIGGAPVQLPPVDAGSGRWSGQWVFDNILYRANLNVSAAYPLAYTTFEEAGCPVADIALMSLITGPAVSPAIGPVICSGSAPIQMSSVPESTEWTGLQPGNILDPALFTGGFIACAYTDPTAASCANVIGPLLAWNSLPAVIAPIGPLCVNAGPQLVVPQNAPASGISWSGDIVSYDAQGATFDPGQGAGTYQVIMSVSPQAPQQCPNSDTLTVVVNDEFPEVSVPPAAIYCQQGAVIDLQGASPIGGTWSGAGVVGDQMDPAIAQEGVHELVYAFTADNGCTTLGSTEITLINATEVSYGADDLLFCKTDEPLQFSATPLGGTWSAPLDENGLFVPGDMTTGSFPLIYTYTDPNGCSVENASETLEVLPITQVGIEPVNALCVDHAPVLIQGSHPGIWSGAVTGSGSSVLFDPAVVGIGVWNVVLDAEAEGECPGSATVQVEVRSCVGISELDALGSLHMAPNPFVERTWISVDANGLMQLDVLDAAGRVVHRTVHAVQGSVTLPVDLSGQPAGSYLVRVQLADQVRHLRAVKVN
ncbi:MAG: T9SS type A sorting domain-containing protein [Flavobacteriales bacterium]|nr:T9SS type A sorting domain-containing protein [Flavobacteriales bacterium]